MKTLLQFSGPPQRVNEAIKTGALGETLGRLAESIRPEATYFGCADGQRTAFFVFDLKDPADMVRIAETLYMAFADTVRFMPVAGQDELQRGLAASASSQ